METISIETDRLRVTVAPGYGARVTSLLDKASGRDWMTAGGYSDNVGEDAVYASPEAVAWDECFPTVGRWDAGATPWGRNLRDHGDLWGRPWTTDSVSPTALTTTYRDPLFIFRRTLGVEGARLTADYSVESLADAPLPYLWALHGLVAIEAGDRIDIPGLETVEGSFISLDGKPIEAPTVGWSGDPALPFRLDDVQPPERRFAGKFLASGLPSGSASIGRPGQKLTLGWDDQTADLGIWMTYGAWFDHQELAVEPTSAPANDLGQAMARGAKPLAPKERRQWQVTLTVGE